MASEEHDGGFTTEDKTDPRQPRSRASYACLQCRKRKVRCDVTVTGPPCRNCYLDNEECEIAWSRRVSRQFGLRKKIPRVNTSASRSLHNSEANCRQLHVSDQKPLQSKAGGANTSLLGRAPVDIVAAGTPPTVLEAFDSSETTCSSPTPSTETVEDSHSRWQEVIHRSIGELSPDMALLSRTWEAEGDAIHRDIASIDPFYVGYAYYQFLEVSNLSAVPLSDFQYLERQNCLHIPCRSILNAFVRQYFLNLQPILPLLDEAAFWDVYAQGPQARREGTKISLLLFQAMLFACCNFVSCDILKYLGLATKKEARATFYRRTKLLFDMETEVSLIDRSRAALLLASWSYSTYETPRRPSTPWLATAIQLAKEAEAHRYMRFESSSEEYACRKRLWWGCIIRDRLLNLGMRRGIHITASEFDFTVQATLGPGDLKGELGNSMVHDTETQKHLHKVLGMLVSLCVVLTGVLDVALPVGERVDRCRCQQSAAASRLDSTEQALERWYRDATQRLRNLAVPSSKQKRHESLVLFVHLLYMYYYAAKIALSHHQVLRVAITVDASSDSTGCDVGCPSLGQSELQEAVIATTNCLEKLMQLHLVKRLPITAISCTALPLLLHVLEMERQSTDTTMDTKSTAGVQHRLEMLKSAMKTYQFQYEGVDWISSVISHVVHLARWSPVLETQTFRAQQARGLSLSGAKGEVVMQRFKPGLYPRLALMLDTAFSKGRLPEEDSFGGRVTGFLDHNESTPARWPSPMEESSPQLNGDEGCCEDADLSRQGNQPGVPGFIEHEVQLPKDLLSMEFPTTPKRSFVDGGVGIDAPVTEWRDTGQLAFVDDARRFVGGEDGGGFEDGMDWASLLMGEGAGADDLDALLSFSLRSACQSP